MKTDNQYLKGIAKKVGNSDTDGHHTDNYYLKRIEDKISSGGGGGGSYDDTDLKEKMGYSSIPSGKNLQGEIDDLSSSIPDLSDYIAKSSTAGLVKNDGTIDTTQYISQHQDISNYVQKSSTAGLIKNDGTIDQTSYVSDISGKLDIAQTSHKGKNVVVDSSSGDITFEDKPTIPDISGKLDIAQTSYKGKNVVVDGTTGNITFENKPTIPTDVSDLTDNNNTQFTPKSHTHSDKADVEDFDTVTATITYSNNTTETVELYIVPSNNSP